MTPAIRLVATAALSDREVAAIRSLLWRAFEADGDGFGDADWEHALGGVHAIAPLVGRIVGHASVVERLLVADGHALRTGYVEGVATDPALGRHGIGSAVMPALATHIDRTFQFGALSTGRPSFYERLGWRRWSGPTSVRTPAGDERTPDDDGGILYRPTPTTPSLDAAAAISCEWRAGDVW